MDNQTENPFRPPTHANDEATLDADTEFLVSDSCVLCGDEVTLPQVCIHSGRTDGLLKKSAVLTYTPLLLFKLRIILFIFATGPIIEVMNTVILGGRTMRSAKAMFCAITITLAVVSAILYHVTKRRVNCTWWVHPDARTGFLSFLRRSTPIFAGTHRGLNMLVGLAPEFLQRVQKMIGDSVQQKP